MFRVALLLVFLRAIPAFGGTPFEEAQALYHRTDYDGALRFLTKLPVKDGRTWHLIGQTTFMLADYKRATDAFERAVQAEPRNAEYVHWLGKSWGRRAEISGPMLAAIYALRAKQFFEQAVAIDPNDKESLNDLFDYYLEAPAFLGGGTRRAEALVDKIAKLDAAEGHYARAQLADHQKDFEQAEQHLRRAYELSPGQLGRSIDLADYLSKRGRAQESDAVYAQAEKIAPNSPRLMYARANTYIRDKRNLDQARALLKAYLGSNLTADEPSREQATTLLRKAGS
jgi:tetratricopeptide (TPR) repeat protein